MEPSPAAQDEALAPASQAVNGGAWMKPLIEARNHPGRKKSKERTWGLWLADALIYPFVNNVGVFLLSVACTYYTLPGKKDSGGKFASMLEERGKWFQGVMKNKFNMTPEQAEEAQMVAFSFIDGCAMLPFVWGLEQNREPIARAIDSTLGTLPDDPSVYEGEPKQTIWSALGGRVAILSIVLPTYKLLSNLGTKEGSLVWRTAKKTTLSQV